MNAYETAAAAMKQAQDDYDCAKADLENAELVLENAAIAIDRAHVELAKYEERPGVPKAEYR